MALAIKHAPVLTGKVAKDFQDKASQTERDLKHSIDFKKEAAMADAFFKKSSI